MNEENLLLFYEVCIQNEICANCPLISICSKYEMKEKFSVIYEKYLLEKEGSKYE